MHITTHTADTLALLGGKPAISHIDPHPPILGESDVAAAAEVIRGGVLSGYIGAPGAAFMGGPRVQAFEAQCAAHFGNWDKCHFEWHCESERHRHRCLVRMGNGCHAGDQHCHDPPDKRFRDD